MVLDEKKVKFNALFRKVVTSRHYGLVFFFLFLPDMLPHVLCEQVSFTSQLGLLGRGKWACLFVYLDVYLRSHVGVVLFPSSHALRSRGGGILHIFVIGSG